jgi:hypothetical protein
MIARVDAKLERAGYPGGLRGADWVGVKLLSLIGFAVLVFLLGVLLTGEFVVALLFLIVGAGLGYMAPEFWLGRKIRARSQSMVLLLPDVLDLLTISVEAGLGFDAALAKVVEKMEGPLVDEFSQALAEVRMGRPRREALRDVATRADAQPAASSRRSSSSSSGRRWSRSWAAPASRCSRRSDRPSCWSTTTRRCCPSSAAVLVVPASTPGPRLPAGQP